MIYIRHIRKVRNACKILVYNPKEGDHSGDVGVDGKIILKWVLRK